MDERIEPLDLYRERLLRVRARRNLAAFTAYTFRAYEQTWHTRLLCSYLDRMIAGSLRRLMIFMPPRHSKSEHVSVRLPAYILGRNPDAQIIAASYSATLANRLSKMLQRVMDGGEYRRLFPGTRLPSSGGVGETRTVDEFTIAGRRGIYRCAGVGGGITGYGADWGIIDDPFKNRQEAESPAHRDMVWDWYREGFLSRQQPGARLLLMHQRWHEDDLAGRILRADEGHHRWQVLCLPARFEPEHPLRCSEDPRAAGDPLWPEWFDAAHLAEKRDEQGPYGFAAQYQQRPAPAAGGVFKREWLRFCRRRGQGLKAKCIVNNKPYPIQQMVRFATVDLAASLKTTADYTVVMVFGMAEVERVRCLFVLDVIRARLEGPDIAPTIKAAQDRWQLAVVGIERVGMQLHVVQQARRLGIRARELMPDGDKVSRALAATPHLEGGRVLFDPEAEWYSEFERELLSFPTGVHDDQVDCLAYGTLMLEGLLEEAAQPVVVKPNQAAPWHDDEDATKIWARD